jgi:hypothetical protein
MRVPLLDPPTAPIRSERLAVPQRHRLQVQQLGRPDGIRVAALLLRGVFLARDQDLQWFFHGASSDQPEAWARFAAIAPAGQRHAMLAFLAQALIEGDLVQQRAAASAWWQWERAAHRRWPDPR